MQFADHPVNLETRLGSQGVQRAVVNVTGYAEGDLAVWAARAPSALTPDILHALATGAINPAAARAAAYSPFTGQAASYPDWRQDGAMAGLRAGRDLAASPGAGGTTSLTFRLLEPDWDMAPRGPYSASTDTEFVATLERADGPWLLAVTCLRPDGSVDVCQGGLGQPPGREHLAGVWLSPSDQADLTDLGLWLVERVRDFTPTLNARLAALTRLGLPARTVGAVLYTDDYKADLWPAVYVMPGGVRGMGTPESSPDRYDETVLFTLRVTSYSDEPAENTHVLTQLADSLAKMLNTRYYRQGRLPSGVPFNLGRCDAVQFGRTQTEWDNAADVVWACKVVNVGLF